MMRLTIKVTGLFFFYGAFISTEALEVKTTGATTEATLSASVSPISTDNLTSQDTSISTVITTTPTQHVTTATEAVRHSFGRGFPVAHYHLPDSRWGPFFEEGNEPQNLTARVGSTILLDCSIRLLNNKTVTWAHHKKDSIHLLTVGRSAYSSDERITLSFKYPSNFRLQIVYVTRRDEGLYECQVATHPPKVKRVYLKVTAPEVRIVDESGRQVTERYYKAGSGLELTCLATEVGGSVQKHPIIWRHGDRILSEGISPNVSTTADTAVSSLTVAPLKKHHSGNYTCAIESLAFATVAVHVLNGELPAAVHHGNSATTGLISETLIVLLAGYLLERYR